MPPAHITRPPPVRQTHRVSGLLLLVLFLIGALALALPIAGSLAAAFAAVLLLIAVTSGGTLSVTGIITTLALGGAEILFLYFLRYWNLLGWRY